MIDSFPEWLEAAALKGPVLLALDGLSALQSKDDLHLTWLPHLFPPGVKARAHARSPAAALTGMLCGRFWCLPWPTPFRTRL